MIIHTVSFALVHAPGSQEESDFLSTATAALADIPGVQDFTVHRQVSPKSPHTFRFSMVFADQETYDALRATLEEYRERMHSNEPVHTWD